MIFISSLVFKDASTMSEFITIVPPDFTNGINCLNAEMFIANTISGWSREGLYILPSPNFTVQFAVPPLIAEPYCGIHVA